MINADGPQYDDNAHQRQDGLGVAEHNPAADSPELSKSALDFCYEVFSIVQTLTKPSQRKRNTIFKNGCLLLDQEIEPPNVEEPSFSIGTYLTKRSGIPMDHALHILNDAESHLAEAQQQWMHDDFPALVLAAEHPDDRTDRDAYQAAVQYNYGVPVYGDSRTIACDITERWYRSIAEELAASATTDLVEEIRKTVDTWGTRLTDKQANDLLDNARKAWIDAISRNLRHNFLAGVDDDADTDTADAKHFALRGTPRARARVRVWILNYALALGAIHQEIEHDGPDWQILLSKTREVCNKLQVRFPGRGQEETPADSDGSSSRDTAQDAMSVAYSAMIASITSLCNTSVAPDQERTATVFLDQHGALSQTSVVSTIVRYVLKLDERDRNLVGSDVPARPQLIQAWLNLHGAIRDTVPMKDEHGTIILNEDGTVKRTTQYRFPDIAGSERTSSNDTDDKDDDDHQPAYDSAADNTATSSYTRSTIYDTMRVIYGWMQSQHPDIGIPIHPSKLFAPDWRGCMALRAALKTVDSRNPSLQSSAFGEAVYRQYAFDTYDPRLETLSNPKRAVVNSYRKAAKAMMRILYILGGLGGCTFDSIEMIDSHIDAIEHPDSPNVQGPIDASLKIVMFAALATGWAHDPWGSVVGRVRTSLWHRYLTPNPEANDLPEYAVILPNATDFKGIEDVNRAVRIIDRRRRDPLTRTATILVKVNKSDAAAISRKPSSDEDDDTYRQQQRRRDLALHAAEHVICDVQRANLQDAARYATSVDIPGGPDEWSGHDMTVDDYLSGMHERKPYCIGSLNGKVCNYE
ncbi:hypothetical protein EP30_10155 [Bifidobacterium sp. UTCIF-39]|uniref:hypothetical protein n=1 Tax=Bifidobacterium sp. UTCIF-39 TaxID=1465359 RepID=UPI00112E2E13|nr:hypothetical protein [Bifidobacterium sp. UTCIF-39]TPF95878.1 hypothetical protein EP30_10155 [Bifidobacterium sp. UTCIF-39]